MKRIRVTSLADMGPPVELKRRPRQHPAGRLCETCDTRLSIYNGGNRCHAHTPTTYPRWYPHGRRR